MSGLDDETDQITLARGEGGVEVEIVKDEASFGMDDDCVGGSDDEIDRGGGIDNIESAVDEDECTTVKGKYVESAVDTVSCDAHADGLASIQLRYR